MGTFHVTIELGPREGSRFESVNALVDTRSTYSMVPATALERMAIAPQWTSTFELADARQQEYGLAELQVRIDGQQRTTICTFGPVGSEPLLGSYTLEAFGLAADPVNQRLVPARLFLM